VKAFLIERVIIAVRVLQIGGPLVPLQNDRRELAQLPERLVAIQLRHLIEDANKILVVYRVTPWFELESIEGMFGDSLYRHFKALKIFIFSNTKTEVIIDSRAACL